jgi:hypothetical protein
MAIRKENGVCNLRNFDQKREYAPNDRQQFSVDRIDSRQGHMCSDLKYKRWRRWMMKYKRWRRWMMKYKRWRRWTMKYKRWGGGGG